MLRKLKKYFLAHKKRYLIILIALALVIIFGGGTVAGYFIFKTNRKTQVNEEIQKNVYTEFLLEIYAKIQENYWNKVSDEELTGLFKLATEKITEQPQVLSSLDKKGLSEMITKITEQMEENKKKEFSAQLAHLVLINLKPFGRSALYVKKDEENLKNNVQNINPGENLYTTLGAEDNAPQEEIEKNYKEKVAELEKDKSAEAQEQLEKVKYAYEVLSNAADKERYDQSKTEPTVFADLVRPNILHLYISKISPTTLDDLKKETEKFDNIEGLNSLILDLRQNVGGSLDMVPYLLGPFIGPEQYAFELFQQGNYDPFKTKFGWLPSLTQYKKVVILADGETQSSAEVMISAFKKYNVGIFVGTKTKGWGTIEKVYEIENQIDASEKYSVFLVNHLTLRDDNQPIEGTGVEPTIDINDPNWEDKLYEYFNYGELVKAVKEVWSTGPGKI